MTQLHEADKHQFSNAIHRLGRILSPRRCLRQPTPVFSWIFGILLLLDVPVLLITGLITLTLAEESAPDIPPECLSDKPCPATPQQHLRDTTIFYGSLALWFLFVLIMHLAIIALMDDTLSSKHCKVTICTVILLTFITLLGAGCLLNQWVHDVRIVVIYCTSVLVAVLWPAYVSARIRCYPYAHKNTF